MATIRDVASAANVSIATVSRVLNKNRPVQPSIQRAVEEAAQRLNYHPNAAARGLRQARSRTLGVIALDLNNEPYARRVLGIERCIGGRDFGLFVCDARNSADLCVKHLSLLHEHRVEGLLLTPTPSRRIRQMLDQIEEQGTHVVLIGRRAATGEHPEVYIDEDGASLDAFRSLLALGHRRIVYLALGYNNEPGMQWSTATESRIAAYTRAHEEAGVPVETRNFVRALDGDEARAMTACLLAEPDRPTAIVVGVHAYTPDVLLAIREAGLRVPDDVSLIVYGDSRWIEAHDPPISAVCTDDVAYGQRAAELLLALLNGDAPERIIPFPTSFVRRASCAPPCR
jgi:LacI family transcriptional regulator